MACRSTWDNEKQRWILEGWCRICDKAFTAEYSASGTWPKPVDKYDACPECIADPEIHKYLDMKELDIDDEDWRGNGRIGFQNTYVSPTETALAKLKSFIPVKGNDNGTTAIIKLDALESGVQNKPGNNNHGTDGQGI